MSYDETAFEAAAQAVHSSYSDSRLWALEESFGDRIRARGTLKNALRILGPSDESVQVELERDEALGKLAVAEAALTTVRAQALEMQLALTLIWGTAGKDANAGFGDSPHAVLNAVIEAIEAAKSPQGEIEVTDAVLDSFIQGAFPANVVLDVEKIRSALANALQTR